MRSRFFTGVALLLLHLVFVGPNVLGQEGVSTDRPGYFMSVHAGALVGVYGIGSTYTASYIQGIRYKRVAAGLGVGYDGYAAWRTVPWFLSLSYDALRVGAQSVFVRADGGYSYVSNSQTGNREGYYDEKGGLFFHPMVGVRTAAGKLRIYLSAGYKIQRLSYAEDYRWGWYTAGMRKTVNREMQRFSIQLGFGFQ